MRRRHVLRAAISCGVKFFSLRYMLSCLVGICSRSSDQNFGNGARRWFARRFPAEAEEGDADFGVTQLVLWLMALRELQLLLSLL